MKLNDRAVLVQLSVSQWSARKFDKKATKEVADNHGVADGVGRYNKQLLPGQDLLKQVHSKAAAIRQHFYRNTLPWGLEGTFILPTANYLDFMNEYRSMKADWEDTVRHFIAEYPYLKDLAKRYLGNLYNDTDYPDVNDIGRRFKMDMAVFPVPSGDFRVDLANEELGRIQQDVISRVETASQLAMKEVWDRLYEKVEHIAKRLSDPDAVFHKTMFENAQELCELLPKLNVMDDPNLEQMRQQVEAKLLAVHPDAIRNSQTKREEVATDANAILDAMAVFMGGSN